VRAGGLGHFVASGTGLGEQVEVARLPQADLDLIDSAEQGRGQRAAGDVAAGVVPATMTGICPPTALRPATSAVVVSVMATSSG
jgi:hypothetical protein